MTKLIGVIAEDKSDVEVIEEIASKIASRRIFAVKKFIGYGCGRIANKCQSWARNLKLQRCSSLILIHDLDCRVLEQLREEIYQALNPSPIASNIIVIPVREIEAWLLADHVAIVDALNLIHDIKQIPNPEAILNPKERLRDLIWLKSGKRKHYVNTIHNRKIAAYAKVKNLRRCKSFIPLEEFLHITLN